ncbi:MAG TPA: SDR family oxidoreductase, partial [Pseudoduganella sp.]
AVDIRVATAVEEMVDRIWSTGPLDGLVNNAAGNFISQTKDLSPRAFDAIANIVLHGTFYVTQAVGKRWIENGLKGSVVSILVTWVNNGGPFVVPSAMSKAGVNVMTKSLAVEWGRYGIRLNAIAPGAFPTDGMSKRLYPGREDSGRDEGSPMGRVGEMPELQNLATFLMADGVEWMTGQTLTIDGANSLATGGNFYHFKDWSDQDWADAKSSIKALNDKDRAQRTAA